MDYTDKRQFKKHGKRRSAVVCVPERKKRIRRNQKVPCRKRKRKCKKKIIVTRIVYKQGPPGQQGPPGDASIRIIPDVRRYFFVADTDIDLSNTQMIPANRFINDDGEPVNEFVELGDEGYYNLYVNAVLQEGKIYNVNPNALTIYSNEEVIYASTLIILEAVGFSIKRIH